MSVRHKTDVKRQELFTIKELPVLRQMRRQRSRREKQKGASLKPASPVQERMESFSSLDRHRPQQQRTLTSRYPPGMMRDKFIMAARVVRRLCQVAMCMRKYAEDTLGKAFEFMSKPRYRMGDAGGDQELSFDLDYYKKDPEYLFPELAKRVAEKNPEDRTQADLRVIGAALRSLSSFRKYPRKMQDMLCRVARFQSLGANRVVIKKGHPGTAFYLLFSGRVGVVTTDDPDELMQRASMVVLRKGAIFGEVSLITGDARKNTLKTLEQTELIVVDFHRLTDADVNALFKQDVKYKFDFFRKLDLFSPWCDEAVEQLSLLARTHEYVHGRVVVRDMAAEPAVVFVTRGQCDVVKLLDLSNASNQINQDVSTPSSLESSRPLTITATIKNSRSPNKRPSPVPFPPLRPQTVPRDEVRTLDQFEDKKKAIRARSKSATVRSRGGRHDPAEVHKLLSFSDIPLPNDMHEGESGDDIDERCRARAQRRYSRRISDCAQRVGTYMTLSKLEPGETFGLAHVCEVPDLPHLSLVSRGASILHVTLRDFRAVADRQPPLLELDKEIVKVPADRELCERFFQESQWASYKRHMVEQTMVDIHRPKDGLGLRNYDVIDTYPTADNTLVIDTPGSDLPSCNRRRRSSLHQRPRQETPSSRAAQRRLGSEYISSPVYGRDHSGSLRLIDVLQDRSRTPSRNQYGLKCNHFHQDGS